MPAMSLDGQSFTLDGRRLWLVSGTVPYARIPRGQWLPRLLAARDAGLNCVETPVVWSLHEPQEGEFRFEGDLDLAEFIRTIAQLRLHCILRIGPYVGDGYDLGGLPAWLLAGETRHRLRSSDAGFLHAVSKFTAQVCAQVRDLQATSSRGAPGPIVAVQSEHRWFCGDSTQGAAYLGELERFLRENGVSVPIINTNNLFHSPEGQVDAWVADHHLFANLRQLRTLRPDQPRFLMGLSLGAPAVLGRPASDGLSPRAAMRRLAEVLAAGSQYGITPFVSGSGLSGATGAVDGSSDSPLAHAIDLGSPVSESGERSPAFNAIRRVSHFASSFSRVLAALDPSYRPVVTTLDAPAPPPGRRGARSKNAPAPGAAQGITAVECKGGQGTVVFLFAPEAEGDNTTRATLVLADGSTLPVDLGAQPVAWVLMNAHLAGRSTLDYCNLNAFISADSLFVCYGPAGAAGIISINESAFEVSVPTGDEPLVREHEGVTVVVCNESSIDRLYAGEGCVFAGARAVTESGEPLPHPGAKRILRIAHGKKPETIKTSPDAPARRAPSLSGWAFAPCEDHALGTHKKFSKLDGPASLEELGALTGYAWIRVRLNGRAARSGKATVFQHAGRLHPFVDGEPLGVFGEGPGAAPEAVFPLKLPKQGGTLVLLADSAWRPAEGNAMGRPTGLLGHLWEAAPLRLAAPKTEKAAPLRPLAFRSPIFGLDAGDETDTHRLTWTFEHRRKTPIFLVVSPQEETGLVLLNGEPLEVLARGARLGMQLPPERLSRGRNTLQLAVVGDTAHAAKTLKNALSVVEGKSGISEGAEWAWSRWVAPAATAFEDASKAMLSTRRPPALKHRPVWWRASFSVPSTDRPLFLDASGLSKGRITLNGNDLGKYFVAEAEGKAVQPESRLYLPEAWLTTDQPNELLIFDEHGCAPGKCRLVYGAAPSAA